MLRTIFVVTTVPLADALVGLTGTRILATRIGSPDAISMRSAYDTRSATETFEMWTASKAPTGFTWGYDSRSTTENYEQWLVFNSEQEVSSADTPTPPAESAGVASVGESVWSWYDSGMRLTEEEEESGALGKLVGFLKNPAGFTTKDVSASQVDEVRQPAQAAADTTPEATVTKHDGDTIRLTDEQVKAYGGPAVRALTDNPDYSPGLYDGDTVTLTEEQHKAYGGSKVRPLNDVAEALPVEPKEWPSRGGGGGYHRMAGRLTKPELPTAPAVELAGVEATSSPTPPTIITLTEEQHKAYGGSKVRQLNDVAEASPVDGAEATSLPPLSPRAPNARDSLGIPFVTTEATISFDEGFTMEPACGSQQTSNEITYMFDDDSFDVRILAPSIPRGLLFSTEHFNAIGKAGSLQVRIPSASVQGQRQVISNLVALASKYDTTAVMRRSLGTA